jgi:8-oxo-dGTP pyrophosphatase MutT (NUDIX family)
MPHINEKIDFTVDVAIVNRSRVLLRFHDKYAKWLFPGGHIEKHEDPNEAVVREAKEEVGLEIALANGTYRARVPNGEGELIYPEGELIAPRFLNRHPIGDNGHEHVSHIYVATAASDDVRPSGSDRSDQWKWFSRTDLDDPQYSLDPRIRYYAMTALNEVSS